MQFMAMDLLLYSAKSYKVLQQETLRLEFSKTLKLEKIHFYNSGHTVIL